METAQQGWIALYDKYADGKLDRNDFISEKKKYDADMEHMEENELTEDMKDKLIEKVIV